MSQTATITPDGRYVAFQSQATNLVAGGTSFGALHVFVYDRQLGLTTLISSDGNGVQGNDGSYYPHMSANGRFVAFFSFATNLVPNDTNSAKDVFVKDRETGLVTRESVNSDGSQGNGGSEGGISADGRYVTFYSVATNLVSGDTNGTSDVFVRDRQTGATTRVSVDASGDEGNNSSSGIYMSADDRYVVVQSLASNLVPGDTNGTWDMFVHDRQLGVTSRVSVSNDGSQSDGATTFGIISANGRSIAFESDASNLVTDDTNGVKDVFVFDCSDIDADGACGPFDNCPLEPNAGDLDCDRVGDIDEPPCESDPDNAAIRPERIDGAFTGVDDDGDTQVDEALPGGAEGYDCDGDGYSGAPEAGTPLCGNGVNDDTSVYPVYPGPLADDDAVVDDGCPGGPAQAGAFSEAQFNIGLGDQDPCGLNGWPNDFISGGIPDSTNRITLADLTSFLVPVRYLDKSPGHPDFNARWDLVPGRSVPGSPWIQLNDLTALLAGPTAYPPMFGGARGFNGPVCPWPG